MNKYTKYLNLKHDYKTNNCITLINSIYKEQLNSNVLDNLWEVADRSWMRKYSIDFLESWAITVATKVNLTSIQEYDVIIFKSNNLFPIHFGMYISNNKFIHLEENRYSKIDMLNSDWRNKIASIWRWNGINT
jgi:cell wall-associated NlpC family hydrolase